MDRSRREPPPRTVRRSARRTGQPGSESRMKSCFLGRGSAGSSPSASGGRSRGSRPDQTASASAAARNAGETAAARQASRGAVRASVADTRSSGRRAISQRAGAVDSIFGSPTRAASSALCGFDAIGVSRDRAMWGG